MHWMTAVLPALLLVGCVSHSSQNKKTPAIDSQDGNKVVSQDDSEPNPLVSKIHELQGAGIVARSGGAIVEAIVVGSYQDKEQLKGFFIQEEDDQTDKLPETSEAIFVYCGMCETRVQVADQVQVRGEVGEHYGMSQIDTTVQGAYVKVIRSSEPLPKPVTLEFPIPTTQTSVEGVQEEVNAYLEAREGMRVTIETPMTVQDLYALARYGQLSLVAGGRLRQHSDLQRPSAQGYTQQSIELLRRSIVWDDDNNIQNVSTSLTSGDRAIFHPQPEGFSTEHSLRAGDVVQGLTGVLHWSFAGQKGTQAWRIRSLDESPPGLDRPNPRSPVPPSIQGALKVATLNVQNFFSTLDEGDSVCGPRQDLQCRGANSKRELTRQGQKLAAAICAMQADILGITELENNDEASLQALSTAIGQQCSGYDYIDSKSLGTDAIKVGIFYRPAVVRPLGTYQVLDSKSFTDPKSTGRGKNRPALAQAFTDISSEQTLTVVVNHLKSKGSSCGEGDDDRVSGQGNCSGTRTMAALRQIEWLEGLPDAENILVVGDFNAHRYEDPIEVYRKAGYVDIVGTSDPNAHTYVFGGLKGSLDHALANTSLAKKIGTARVWNINADESNLLDYNDDQQDAGEEAYERKTRSKPLFASDPFRSADHNPILIGTNLAGPWSTGQFGECSVEGLASAPGFPLARRLLFFSSRKKEKFVRKIGSWLKG